MNKIIREPIINVDATPDIEYPIRILKAYRENCNCVWTDNTIGEEPANPIYRQMNEDCRKRVAILDKAIRILEEEMWK